MKIIVNYDFEGNEIISEVIDYYEWLTTDFPMRGVINNTASDMINGVMVKKSVVKLMEYYLPVLVVLDRGFKFIYADDIAFVYEVRYSISENKRYVDISNIIGLPCSIRNDESVHKLPDVVSFDEYCYAMSPIEQLIIDPSTGEVLGNANNNDYANDVNHGKYIILDCICNKNRVS